MAAADRDPPATESLYDQAACGLLVTDRVGLILRANATFCRWLDRRPDELVGQRRLQDLLTVGGRIFHQTHWAPLLQLQGSIAEVKLDLVHRAGHAVPMMMNAIARLHDGELLHEVAMFVAEDRHAYERELLAARRQAESLLAQEKDRALFAEQMIGIVSHDLRGPLSTVSTGVDLLERLGGGGELAQVVSGIRRSTQRARRLIDDLLDFTRARIGSGLQVAVQPVELHEVVAAQVHELVLSFGGRAIVHHREGEGDCHADTDRLYQVTSNLVANAMAHGDPDRPVTVSSEIGPSNFCLAVHNHGAPIRPELLPSLFQPMVRGHASTASRSVGLGLYIVREIAKAHGGDVEVKSTRESGTRFRVRFARHPLSETPTVF